jgi:superfamily II DNA or RNA helicase
MYGKIVQNNQALRMLNTCITSSKNNDFKIVHGIRWEICLSSDSYGKKKGNLSPNHSKQWSNHFHLAMEGPMFSWDVFNDETVKSLVAAFGEDITTITGAMARKKLSQQFVRPDEEFVKQTKDALVEVWLPQYTDAKLIVDHLRDEGIGPMCKARNQKDYVRYIKQTRNCLTLRKLLVDALLHFGGDEHYHDLSEGLIPRFAVLKIADQPVDRREGHDYQQRAWEALSANLSLAEAEASKVFNGLLVMPTGAGKTFTTVRWLITNVLCRGGRVLWLAHRHELLEHAAAEFHRMTGWLDSKMDLLRVRIVSGKHCAAHQIDPADHVICASVASLARRPDIREGLLKDPRLFLVVDEAHHSAAKSYYDIIKSLQKKIAYRMLGITATPTRTIDDERRILSKLFGGKIIYQTELRELVERGILSRPKPVRIQTEVNAEEGITKRDIDHIQQFQELTPEWLGRIATMTKRNRLIIDHFLKNQERYGKTLIFAINVTHAALLKEELCAQGIRAEYVASYRPDKTPGDPMDVIGRFRDGSLDVLINVQILTEGFDVPAIQTVMLTRPTQSEILVRQMNGRALRGPMVGGTEDAFIVSFEDHWQRFRDWESPLDLAPDIENVVVDLEDSTEREGSPSMADHLPWDLIRATSAAIRERGFEYKADAFEAVPHGWYVLERETADQLHRVTLPVYAHQQKCWEALFDELSGKTHHLKDDEDAIDDLFSDCDDPKPSDYDIQRVLGHFEHGGERPEFITLSDREWYDPYFIAEKIWIEDLGEKAKCLLVEERYQGRVSSSGRRSSLAMAIYPSLREYRAAIEDALFELRYPDSATRIHRAVPIFDPGPEEQLTPGPAHNLNELFQKVMAEGERLLGVQSLPNEECSIRWSRRLVKGWYGKATWVKTAPVGAGEIVINKLLDSGDISEETIQYLLWHEYLHLFLKDNHTKTFREYENYWPTGRSTALHELDNLNERFGIQYW